MAEYVPTPHRPYDLIASAAQGIGGVAQSMQTQRRVHPVLESILRKYGAALEKGEITAEEVMPILKTELAAHNNNTAPTSLGDQVPVAQAPAGDVPEKVSVPAGQSAAHTGTQATMGAEGGMPSAQPGGAVSLGQPMGQANAVASDVMGGKQQSPQLGRPQSLADLGAAAQGEMNLGMPDQMPGTQMPPAARPMPQQRMGLPQVARGNVGAPSDRPMTAQDIEDFSKASSFIGVSQRPELEKMKADAKVKAAKVTADARKDLETFKQSNQNSRMAAKLDVALRTAQGRLDMDGQKVVAHMTEVLLQIQGRLMQAREQIAAKMAAKEGDWKVAVMAIKQRVIDGSKRLMGQVSNSMNYIADPKIQAILDDAMSDAEGDMRDFEALQVEVGEERGSPALANPPSKQGTTPAAPAPTKKTPGKTPAKKSKLSTEEDALLKELGG